MFALLCKPVVSQSQEDKLEIEILEAPPIKINDRDL